MRPSGTGTRSAARSSAAVAVAVTTAATSAADMAVRAAILFTSLSLRGLRGRYRRGPSGA